MEQKIENLNRAGSDALKELRMQDRRTFIAAFQNKTGSCLENQKCLCGLQWGRYKAENLRIGIVQICRLMFDQVTDFTGIIKSLNLFLLVLVDLKGSVLMVVQGRNQKRTQKNKQQKNCSCLGDDVRKIFPFQIH